MWFFSWSQPLPQSYFIYEQRVLGIRLSPSSPFLTMFDVSSSSTCVLWQSFRPSGATVVSEIENWWKSLTLEQKKKKICVFFLNWCLHSHGGCQSAVWFLGRHEGRRVQLARGQESGGVNPTATKPSHSPLFSPLFNPSIAVCEQVERLSSHFCSTV